MSGWKLKFVYHNSLYFWKEHEMMIPTVPISIGLNEYSTVFKIQLVCWKSRSFYGYIVVTKVSASDCKLNQIEWNSLWMILCSNEGCSQYNPCTRHNKCLIMGHKLLPFQRSWSKVTIKKPVPPHWTTTLVIKAVRQVGAWGCWSTPNFHYTLLAVLCCGYVLYPSNTNAKS